MPIKVIAPFWLFYSAENTHSSQIRPDDYVAHSAVTDNNLREDGVTYSSAQCGRFSYTRKGSGTASNV